MTAGSPAHPRSGRLTAALFAGGIATFAELYAVQAVLPGLAAEWDLTESEATLAISVATGALAVSVLPWAAVGDRFGRARAMRGSAIVAVAPSYGVLLALRAVSGFALGALPALAVAHLVVSAPPARIASVGGLYIAGTTIGGLSGRVLTAAVGGLVGWRWGLLTTAAFVAVAAAVFVVLLESPSTAAQLAATAAGRPAGQRARLRRALADRVVWVFYTQAFLLMGAFVTIYNLLAFRLLADPYRLPASIVGLLFLTYLVGTVGSSAVGRMVAMVGRRRMLAAAGTVMALGSAVTLFNPLWCIVTGLVLGTFAFFVAHAIAATWAGERVPTARSQATAVYSLAYYAGSSLVGLLGAALFARGGWPAAMAMVIAITLAASAVAFVGAPRLDSHADARQSSAA